jgi:hypothetical protein
MKTFIREHASNRNIIILLILLILFQVLFTHLLPQGEHAVMLDTRLFYNAGSAYEIIDHYTDAMRRGFILGEVTLDLIFPPVYTLLLIFLLYRLFKNTNIALFPVSILVFDYLENTGIVLMLVKYPQKYIFIAGASAVFSAMKWLLLMLTLLFFAAGLFPRLRQYFSKHS